MQIANGVNVRQNLKILSNYETDVGYHSSVYDFLNLHWAWDAMEWNDGQQWYWPEATPDTIEILVKDLAQQWLVSYKEIYSQFIDDNTL